MKRILSLVCILLYLNLSAQAITLYNAFLGKYDFTMIGNSLNTVPNGTSAPCIINTSSSATLNLLPHQTIQAAYLYWAGSGSLSNGDLNIKLNGVDITPDRTFLSAMGSNNLPVYGAFKDVTDIVLANGNGVYTVSDFDLSGVIGPYCSTGGNFGGWSIVVIYADPTTTNNLVNVYDGFTKVDASSPVINITLNNLNVLNLTGNKIGFLSWEGDENIAVSEQLRINNNIVSNPPLNPANNVFNGTNSFTNSSTLYNMDLDVFDINDYTNIFDNTLDITLQSYQDAVVVNNIVVVLNSEVPDASIQINTADSPCDIRDIEVDYTVSNLIATQALPAGTQIAFYADAQLVGMAATQNDIPIGGSESGSIVLTIPMSIPQTFTLTVRVDDDGTGNGNVIEFNEENNEQQTTITLGITPTVNPYQNLVACDLNDDGVVTFDLTQVGTQMLGAQTGVEIRYYTTAADALAGNTNNITNPNAFSNTSSPQTLYVRMEDVVGCAIVQDFQIEVIPAEEFTYTLPNLIQCSPSLTPTGISFDLTENEGAILNGNDPTQFTVSYHLTQNEARSGANPIANPTNFLNTSNPQTIWARLVSSEDCVQYGSFQLETTAPEQITYNLPNLTFCSPTSLLTGITVDLTQNEEAILNGNNPDDFTLTYHLSQNDAANGVAAIANPGAFVTTSNPQTIWVRLMDAENCVQYGSFEIEITGPEAMDYSIPSLVTCSPDQILVGVETDLTVNEEIILNGNDPAQFTITYHLTQNDAMNGVNAIVNPTTYANNSSPQTIWVRMIGPDNCVLYGNFQLTYNPAPLTQSISPVEECSMSGPATFDLTQLNSLIVNNVNNLTFTYHETLADAENGTNPLPNLYTPATQSATIYVRVEDNLGCFSIVAVQLESVVNMATIPATYFECDSPYEENDGFTSFNLTTMQDQIDFGLGLVNSIISFHTTLADAELGANAIPNPTNYTNTSNPQTLYARALRPDGSCGGIAEFNIQVAPVPEFELPEYLAYCPGDSKTYTFYGPYQTFIWRNPSGEVVSNSATVQFTEAGSWTLEVRDTPNGCPAIRDIEVIFDNSPIITNIEVNGNTVIVSANGGTPPYTYSYNNGLTWTNHYILENVPGGIFDLIVMSKYGCISTAKSFGVLGVPNFISPNGDGKNDNWEIRGLEAYPNAWIQIFDRYGKLFVDRKLDPGFRWDGTYMGRPVPSGDYWYIIKIEDGKTVSGHISVRNRN